MKIKTSTTVLFSILSLLAANVAFASAQVFKFPLLTSVSIASNGADKTKAKIGDAITVQFTANENIQSVKVTIDGSSATIKGGPMNFTASQKMVDASQEGKVPFTIDFMDSYGDKGLTVTSTSDGSGVIFDKGAPSLSEVTPVTSPTQQTTPSYIFYSTNDGNILYGKDCSSSQVTAQEGNNIIIFNTLAEGTHNSCTLQLKDSMGHLSNVLKVSPFTVDFSIPTLPSVSIGSSNVKPDTATIGDMIIVKFTASEKLQMPAVTIGGSSANVKGGPLSWQASQTVVSANTEGSVPFTIDFSDLAGNKGNEVNTTTDGSKVIFSNAQTQNSGKVLGVTTTRFQQNLKGFVPFFFSIFLHAIFIR